MMIYLWKNRLRPSFGSFLWAKQWAKRVWTLPALACFGWRVARFRLRGAKVGEGTLVAPMQGGGKWNLLNIGRNSFVGRATLQLHAEIKIGDCVCINDGVRLLTASHDVRDPHWEQFAKPIVIEDFAWVATGAIILPGVRIGRGAVVGAGAVVAQNVPPGAVATGNPVQIREKVRWEQLDYSPVDFLAFRTAWLGTALPKTNS